MNMKKFLCLLWTVAAFGFSSCSIHVSKEVYNNSAEYAAGKYLLAEDYFKGTKLHPQDKAKAYQLYKASADMNYAPAMFRLAAFYDRGDVVEKDPQMYIQLLTKAAQLGEDRAQNSLGVCYHDGVGVKQDYAVARHWYEKALENGNTKALENISFLCADQKDTLGMKKYVAMGVERGLARSQFLMAEMYRQGIGVEKDLAQAEEWYKKAAENGYLSAYSSLSVIQFDRKDYKATWKFVSEGMNKGDTNAFYNAGFLCEHGLGVEADCLLATQYYQHAIQYENGNQARAYFQLGRILYEGCDKVERDEQKGLEYIRKAAQMGNPEAAEYKVTK